MSKKKNNISNSNPTYEVVKKIRGDWGGVKPYTRVEGGGYHWEYIEGKQYDD